jgi:8-oxo-dGTP diphosphatase
MEQEPSTKVGISVVVVKDNKILLGKRKGSHGSGEYACPGGHLEYLESFETCAKRETLEETGIEIENIRFLCVTNLTKYAPKHYVDIGLVVDWKSGVPTIREEEKCDGWDWYDLDSLPKPLFGCVSNFIEALKTGKTYFTE